MATPFNPDDIHLGVWTNWSYGPTRGSTLTLSRDHGALLTAFIAMFVGYAGTRAWRLICWVLHLSISSDLPSNAVYHQRQNILRNSSSGDAAFWDFLFVSWAWRRILRRKVMTNVLPLLILSASLSLLFAAAGIFSSQISRAMGNEVLISGNNCGFPNISRAVKDIALAVATQNTAIAQDYQEALNRARQCYNKDSRTEDCPIYVSRSLPVNAHSNASCPFKAEMCVKDVQALWLDTGLLNSHDHYGINTRTEDRVAWRQVAHCAPVNTEGFSQRSTWKYDQNMEQILLQPGAEMVQLFYGIDNGPGYPNMTYQYPANYTEMTKGQLFQGPAEDYRLGTAIALSNTTGGSLNSQLIPIPQLFREDADTQLFFLSANSITFLHPSDDAWFPAHQATAEIGMLDQFNLSHIERFTTYRPDHAVTVMGCATSIQYCNPNMPIETGCSAFMGMGVNIDDMDLSMFDTEFQRQLMSTFLVLVGWLSMGRADSMVNMATILGSSILQARESLSLGLQPLLADNQWELEMRGMFAALLALQQKLAIRQAVGPGPGIPREELNSAFDQILCHNQKVVSTNFTSFSVLGISLTFALGGLLILLSYILEPVSSWLQKRHKWDNYALIEWTMNEKLHLQASAHEGVGCGTWSEKRGTVPLTHGPELLAIIDCNDAEHPRWKEPPLATTLRESETKENDSETSETV